jgi:hypothetical protein
VAPQLSEALRKYLDVISPDTEEIIKRYERARVRYDAFRTEVDAAEARQEGMDRLGKIKFNRDEAEMDMMRLQQVGRPLLPRRRRRRHRPSNALLVLRCLSRRLATPFDPGRAHGPGGCALLNAARPLPRQTVGFKLALCRDKLEDEVHAAMERAWGGHEALWEGGAEICRAFYAQRERTFAAALSY